MPDRKLVFAAACLGMLVFGIVFATLGAVLPSVIERYGVDKARAGSLFIAQSLGILAGSLVLGPIVDRYGYKSLLLLCSGLVALGLEGIAFAPSFTWLQMAVLAIGFGGGVINGGANALVADISEGGRAAGLSYLGIFFGLGAIGVPFALGLLLRHFTYSTLVSATGLLVLLTLGFLAAVRFPAPKQPRGFPLARSLGLVRERLLVLLGLTLFLQSGIETSVGGWTATYGVEELGLAGHRGLLFLSLYWLGMVLARLALGALLGRVSPSRALGLSMAVSFLGSLVLRAAREPAPAAAGIFLLGAGLAAGFPVVLGLVGDRYSSLSGTAFGIVLAVALLGGMLVPYLTGILGEAYGLRAAFLIVPAGLAGQALLLAAALRHTREG
jgi:fucose permease